MLTATSLELLALAVTLLVPLFFIAPLAPPKPPRFLLKYLPHVDLVPVARSAASVATPPMNRPIFVVQPLRAPSRIPSQVADIHSIEAPDLGLPTGNSPAGTGEYTALMGTLSIQGELAPPPATKPQAAAKTKGPLAVSQGVQQAKLINQVLPRYPELARQTRQFGTVHLVAIVGKDGRVKEIQAIDGPVFLRQAAVEAVKQWVYKPTLLNGQAVEVLAPIDIHFTLN